MSSCAALRRIAHIALCWHAGAKRILAMLGLSTLRGIVRMTLRLVYGLRVEGAELVPRESGALLVANHLSYIDPLLIAASLPRPVRFIIYEGHHRRLWLRPLAVLARAIPLSPAMGPREMIGALRVATQAIRRGELVCIFAEGQISRIGSLLPFGRGLEHVMRGVSAPIIPVALDNVWGSVFSLSHARFAWRGPSPRHGPMAVLIGSPVPGAAKAHDVRRAVAALLTDAWNRRKRQARALGAALIHTARRNPFRFAMADSRTGALRFGPALSRAIVLARRLRPILSRKECVGVLLPPSVAAALTNHALLLLGRIPVNLNYTLSREALSSCIRQCDLRYVITSRAFMERIRLAIPINRLFLEDVALGVGFGEKTTASFAAAVLPAPILRRWLGARCVSPDETATVIFSSGSTGEPKGIELSHWNVTANVWQLGHVFPLNGRDRMLGALPFFHSFGFTVTYALPALLGIGAVYHANPSEAGSIGKLAQRYSATFLPSTPTFLAHYARRIPAASFGSLRYVLAGAEKLRDAAIDVFEDRFGIRPREGYGCTECAPVVCASADDFRAAGVRQAGARRHSVGHPLPGISVRIVDPVTMAALPPDRPGLLLVHGPNVMKRYLGRPELTAAVFHEDYYVTGDIASTDSSGFVEITDRLSRFAKIGGEMVPLISVEETLQTLTGVCERALVVSSVPDARRGERLAVLHTLSAKALRGVLASLPSSKLPRLWTPRPNDFIRVNAIPCLGSGKLDLARVREIAMSARQC